MTTQRARKMVLTDEQRVRVVAGRIRFARLVIAAVALAFVGTGIAFLLLPARHDVILKSALGLFFVVLGTGTGFFAWRGDWTPPDKERWERQRIVVNRMSLVFGSMELLVLSLCLLGLVAPDQFGDYWHGHRGLVMVACAGLLAHLFMRIAQFVATHRAKAGDSAEPA